MKAAVGPSGERNSFRFTSIPFALLSHPVRWMGSLCFRHQKSPPAQLQPASPWDFHGPQTPLKQLPFHLLMSAASRASFKGGEEAVPLSSVTSSPRNITSPHQKDTPHLARVEPSMSPPVPLADPGHRHLEREFLIQHGWGAHTGHLAERISAL